MRNIGKCEDIDGCQEPATVVVCTICNVRTDYIWEKEEDEELMDHHPDCGHISEALFCRTHGEAMKRRPSVSEGIR